MSKQQKIKVPAKMVAAAAKSSEDLVKKVRAEKRTNGVIAKRVLLAEELLETSIGHVIKNVREIVNG